MHLGPALGQKRRGHDVAHADVGLARLGLRALLAFLPLQVDERMRVEILEQAQHLQHLHLEALHVGIQRVGMVRKMLANRLHALRERVQQRGRKRRVHRVVFGLLLVERAPLLLDGSERLLHARRGFGRGGLRRLLERLRRQRGAEHAARAVHEVVRLVDEQRHAPVVGLRERVQQPAEIEEIVVVAHHHIDPARQLLRQVVRADAVHQRDRAHALLIEQLRGLGQGIGTRIGQAVEEALGERAGIAMAGAAGVLAGLVARHHFKHADRLATMRAQLAQRIERELPPRGLGRQVEQPVDALPRHGLERRENRARRLADARRCLREQHAALGGRAVHAFGQFALAGAELRMRKCQRAQGRVACDAVLGFELCPIDEKLALRLEKFAQRVGAPVLGEHRLAFAVDVEIHQRDVERCEPARLAHQPAVDPRLRPMQFALRG